MLRRKPGAPIPTDPIDLELLEAVDEGVPWRGLLRSASCPPEEAEGRLMRLLAMGVLEGAPGEDSAPPSLRAPATSSAPPRPTSTTPPAQAQRSAPPPGSAGESLLRELMRRSGVGHAPVGAGRPSEAPPTSRPAYDPYRRSTLPPQAKSASSTPPARPPSSEVPPQRSRPPSATGLDSAPPRTMSTPAMASIAVDSPLVGLIEELAHGQGLERWAAARLREALAEEMGENFTQAVAILQIVMAQIEDPRIRQQRDRLQQRIKQADSGIFRSRALQLERAMRHQEAAEHWGKVLDALPQDSEAALHGALCAMECGNLKQAGQFARRAVELSPSSVTAHRLLHRFFRKTGMEASARREAEIIEKLRKA